LAKLVQQSQKSRTRALQVQRRNQAAMAAARLKTLSPLRPSLAVILGSGFQHIFESLRKSSHIPYSRLPGFPKTSVIGHPGQAHVGILGNTPVLMLAGRTHYYEGYSMAEVTWPVRALWEYGIRDLLVTNAAGGLNPLWHPGDFMMITDHINLMGANPLRGPAQRGLPRFVDLSCAYDPELRKLLTRAAKACDLKLRSGVYLAVSGPSYETPAEIRAFARLGANAVGMSTVPEVIVARQLGIRVAALSCITNLAAVLGSDPISHDEVLQTADRAKQQSKEVLTGVAAEYLQNWRSAPRLNKSR
jgi:purine-nucleoside phosphorylase